MTAADRFDLERFVSAQAPVLPAVLAELKAGRKRSYWMWFVFPQMSGLGHSAIATFYGIGRLAARGARLWPSRRPYEDRPINHVGRFFKVKRPLSVVPSPQGHPVLIQARHMGRGDFKLVHLQCGPRGQLQSIVELLVPELQRLGRFRTAYTSRTLRENLAG